MTDESEKRPRVSKGDKPSACLPRSVGWEWYEPVEDERLGSLLDAVQDDVVLHELEHLQLVCDVERRLDTASSGNR